MISTLTATEAATLAGITVAAVRGLCRTGAVEAAKVSGRWQVVTSSLLHRLNRPVRRPADRLRKGDAVPQRSGRAACRAEARAKARALARKHGMRVITHVHRAHVAAHNAGLLLAGQFLTDLTGDRQFAATYGSAFGKACKAEYKRSHDGAEPAQDGLCIAGGRVRPAHNYGSDLDLIAGARAYKRTALLLAA